MSNDRAEIAERLFDTYSRNLTWYHPHLVDVILCPLCLQSFAKDAIQSNRLTLEHIIPSALGGRFLTLTCSDCNSQSGTKLDAHLVQRLRTEDALAGKSKKPLRIRVQIGSGEFGADLHLSQEPQANIQIIGIPAISDPKLHKRAIEAFETQTKEFSISGNLGYKDIPSRVAVLRIAYLLAFSYFGYGYILYSNLDQVREQIFQSEHETDALKGMVLLKSAPKANSIGLLKQPQELRCFIAFISLFTEQQRVLGIALPGPDADSATIYQRWSASAANLNADTEAIVDIIDFDPSYVSDSGYKFLPARIWRGQTTIGDEQSNQV